MLMYKIEVIVINLTNSFLLHAIAYSSVAAALSWASTNKNFIYWYSLFYKLALYSILLRLCVVHILCARFFFDACILNLGVNFDGYIYHFQIQLTMYVVQHVQVCIMPH